MGLFDRFSDTIFLKEDSNLETQIAELKQIRDRVKDKDKIDKDIHLLEMGLQGEKEISFELKHANLGMYVLHDITLEYEDLKAQIDYVIVTKGFTYLVECKNLIGNITVDNKGEFQREYEYKGKKYKEGIYSPYTQAKRHKEIIKKRWLRNSNALRIALGEKSFDKYWYKSIVVLANSKSLLNTKYAPKEIKDSVIRVDQLIDYISKDIDNYDKDLYSNQKNMEKSAISFKEAHIEEYNSVAKKYEEELKKESSNDGLICPKCGGKLVKRNGYSVFYGCSNYPKCKYTRQVKEYQV